MEHHTTTSRAEAERLLGIAEKLLGNKDLSGSRDFAILAQETEPLLDGSDQILAVAEVLLASESKLTNNQHNWYSILQIPPGTNEPELIKKQYRRLALLLHPDKNKFAFADSAFRLVADAWAVLSDSTRKSVYDAETAAANPRFSKVDLTKKQFGKKDNSGHKLPVRRSGGRKNTATATPHPAQRNNVNSKGDVHLGNFWTSCPYCHNLYEYPRVYEGCCLRCENDKCRRAFTGAEILSMPPLVPGREAYYCCWGVFPMGFVEEGGNADGFSKWMPPMFVQETAEPPPAPPVQVAAQVPRAQAAVPVHGSATRKRGRPRKNV